jgi:hypothetical protein
MLEIHGYATKHNEDKHNIFFAIKASSEEYKICINWMKYEFYTNRVFLNKFERNLENLLF